MADMYQIRGMKIPVNDSAPGHDPRDIPQAIFDLSAPA
jgi:hypothetical protein